METATKSKDREAECGILAFLQPSIQGFQCRFKTKWQDFHVYEVDLTGTELHLDELITPGAVAAGLKASNEARKDLRASLGSGFAPEPDILATLESALGADVTSGLIAFMRKQRPTGRAAKVAAAAAAVENEAEVAIQTANNQESAEKSHGDQDVKEQTQDSNQLVGMDSEQTHFVDFDSATIGDGSKDARKGAHRAILDAYGTILNTETVESEGGIRTLRVWMRDAELRIKGPAGSGASAASPASDDLNSGGKASGKKGKGKKGKGKKGKGKKGNAAKDGHDCAGEEFGSEANSYGTFRREGWPKDRPDYLYFRMYKENCDTSEAINCIARCVGRSPKQFTFAGTKDRRASTVQLVCAHRLPDDQLRRTLTHRGWDRRLRISSLEYRSSRLRLGQLLGNRFRVVLRGVHADIQQATVQAAFAAVEVRGFLNYFGLQRFGTRATGTHHTGMMLIAGKWETAIRLIFGDVDAFPIGSCRKRSAEVLGDDAGVQPPAKLAHTESSAGKADNVNIDEIDDSGVQPSPHSGKESDHERSKGKGKSKGGCKNSVVDAQRIYLDSGDPQRALDAMPKNMHIERCILGALAQHLSPIEALKKLPHQALSLYAHAAQSFVWNTVLSRRLADLGPDPVVGDLVFAGPADATADMPMDDEMLEGESDDEQHDDEATGDMAGLPAVRELKTPEDVASVSFFDVVLPLPGSEVHYPSSAKSAYLDAVADLGFTLEDFHNSTLVPLRGAYRHVAIRPKCLEWRLAPPQEVNTAPHGVLLKSDVAQLLADRPDWNDKAETEAGEVASALPPSSESLGASTKAAEATEVSERQRDGGAVVFSVQLPPSSYLTMFLREVSKCPAAILDARD